MTTPITVVAVAGALLVRAGIIAVVSVATDLRLAAAVASPAEADAAIERLRPEVVLVDHEPAGSGGFARGGGLAYGTRLRQSRPDLGVVLVAASDDDLVLRALNAGISAFVPRTAPVEALLAAIRHAAAAPGSFTAPDLAAALARYPGPANTLSAREAEVLALAAGGRSARAIAAALGIGESTVKTYLARAYEKLGVRTRAEALRWIEEH